MPRIKFLGLLLFLGFIALSLPQQAHATISAPLNLCDTGNTASNPLSCNTASGTCPSNNSLVFLLVMGYNPATIAITNDGAALTWFTEVDVGNGVGYHLAMYAAQLPVGRCLIITATYSGGGGLSFSHMTVLQFTGHLATGDPIDAASGITYTSGTGDHSTSVTTTWNGDAAISQEACNTGSPGFDFPTNYDNTKTFTPTGVFYYGATIIGNTTGAPGIKSVNWIAHAGNSGCVFTAGLYGIVTQVTIKAADGAPSSPYKNVQIINYHLREGLSSNMKKIPWANRRRKFEIVRI